MGAVFNIVAVGYVEGVYVTFIVVPSPFDGNLFNSDGLSSHESLDYFVCINERTLKVAYEARETSRASIIHSYGICVRIQSNSSFRV